MKTDKAFVSILTTDSYLPGILVLNDSLKSVGSKFPLDVLLTPNISSHVLDALNKNSIIHHVLPSEIHNPTNVSTDHRWFPTYSKLAIFNQTQYQKIVYLDADMLVLRNIDELFEYPHMSAVTDGGILPRKKGRKYRHDGQNW